MEFNSWNSLILSSAFRVKARSQSFQWLKSEVLNFPVMASIERLAVDFESP